MKCKLKQESTEVMLGEQEEVSAEYRFAEVLEFCVADRILFFANG